MGATLFGASTLQPPSGPSRRRTESLALVFQEILTVIVRVRSNRQPVTDAQKFRADMRSALKGAEKDAIARGYVPEDIRVATFAIVAFLDESVFNSANPAFSDWARMPLQEEMYGNQLAGETFFQYLDRVLTRSDSNETADVLEVFLLCLLLGFRGRYELAGPEAVRPVIDSVAERIRRVRGPLVGFSPAWAVPEGPVARSTPDPWIRRLMLAAGLSLVLALVLFVVFKIFLNMGASALRAIAAQSHL